MAVSGTLAIVKVVTGLSGHSTAVVADGLESAGDVFSSGFVLLGLTLAARPPDENHPYGHGRIEILTGLLIGLILTAGGALISFHAIERVGRPGEVLAAYVVWPLVASLLARTVMALTKFHFARKLRSAALRADAWNDAMDTVSAIAALIAVGLTLTHPARFPNADRYGGFVVGLIVISAGVRVAYDTAMQLIDTMPEDRPDEADPRRGPGGDRRARRGEMFRAQDRHALPRGPAPGSGPRDDRAAIARAGAPRAAARADDAGLGGGRAGARGAGAVKPLRVAVFGFVSGVESVD